MMTMKEVLLKTVPFFMRIDESTDPESPNAEKIAVMEYIPIFTSGIAMIGPYSNLGEAWADWQGKTEDEQKAILEEVKLEFDLRNDRIEIAVEASIVWIGHTVTYINALKGLRKAEEAGIEAATIAA